MNEILIQLKVEYRKKFIRLIGVSSATLFLITAITFYIDKSIYKEEFNRYKEEYPSLLVQYEDNINEYKNHDPTIGGFYAYCDVGEAWIEGEDATDTMRVEFSEGAAAYDEPTLNGDCETYIPFNSPFHVTAFIYDSEYDDEYPMLYSINSSTFTKSPDDVRYLEYEESDGYGGEETFYEDFNVEVSLDGFFYESDDPYYAYKEYDVSVNAILTFHIIEDSVDYPGPMSKPTKPELPKFNYNFWIFIKQSSIIKWIFFIWVVILIFRFRLLKDDYISKKETMEDQYGRSY